MNNMIYALMGPHASGKATMAAHLVSMGVHLIPTYTTADFSKYKELQQKNIKVNLYHPVNLEQFQKLDFLFRFTYKGDYYGVLKEDILNSLRDYPVSVILLDSSGVKQLHKLIKKNLATVFLMVDYVTLVDRMLKLNYSNDEIKYHLQYAESNKEFDGWKITDHVIKNTGDFRLAFMQLLAIMNLVSPLPAADWRLRTQSQHTD